MRFSIAVTLADNHPQEVTAMEAIQTNREAPRRSIICMVALAVAAVIGLDIRPASACENIGTTSTTVGPAGASFTSSGTVTFTLGGTTVTCNASASGTIPSSPNNHNDAGSVCTHNPTVSFSNCTSSLGGTVTAKVSGTWWIVFQDDPNGDKGGLWIPGQGLTITVKLLGATCTATNSTAVDLIAPAADGTLDYSAGVSVPVTSSGGFPCPSGNTATFKGKFTSNPTITIDP